MSVPRKIRVLVVDDSALARKAISDILRDDPEIEVVGTANDPYMARDKIMELNPDVLTLDVEMPRMDGISFLRILQKHRPVPAVIVSSVTQAGSKAALGALAAGAVDVLAKPSGPRTLGNLEAQLAYRVKGAAGARGIPPVTAKPLPCPAARKTYDPRQIILLGASTGGVEALSSVLSRLPGGLPGICLVQHIPPVFSRTFAERLNQTCKMEVREASQGDEVRPGTCLVAPGDYHLRLEFWHGRYRVKLSQSPLLHFTRPAVDVLFESAAACAGSHAVAALLTGMGRDGAQGMKMLKAAGARTLAQNEETCVVYGMPRAAVELGAVDRQVSLENFPQAIIHELDRHAQPAAARRDCQVYAH
ncbi:MAG TPA: chemotaxis response regulator protein-glutamate methylesterase [Verrucomicrobiae bacterium]|jgi:two-component system chemotaxis response regulator CheB